MPRGVPQVDVTFDIDANGILNVSAMEKSTGKEQKIRIEASSGLSDDEIKRMKNDAEANAEADKKAKEEAVKINEADSMIFQTEKQLKEYGDKIPADKKSTIESALSELKNAHASHDLNAIDTALTNINAAWAAASEDMYKATQEAPNGEAQGEAAQNQGADVTDVDFEEVKDEQK
jgi:molecular chaperone DnaK